MVWVFSLRDFLADILSAALAVGPRQEGSRPGEAGVTRAG